MMTKFEKNYLIRCENELLALGIMYQDRTGLNRKRYGVEVGIEAKRIKQPERVAFLEAEIKRISK